MAEKDEYLITLADAYENVLYKQTGITEPQKLFSFDAKT